MRASAIVSIGDITDIVSGFAFKSNGFNTEGSGLPLIRIRDVVRGYTDTYFDGAYDPNFIVENGDILIGMDGEFNRAKWQSGAALLNQRVCKIKGKTQHLDNGYLYHFLPKALKDIEDRTPFVTVKHLSVKDLRAIQLSLPPLDEQKRIAAILDKADQLRQKRRQAIALLDSLTQSIFLEMFGALTRKIRLEEVCARITDGTHQAPNWSVDGVPFLFVSNIRNQNISFETNKYVSAEEYLRLTKNCPIEAGDVLYTAVGSYGNAAVVPPGKTFVFQRHIAHIKPYVERINPVFLARALESDTVRQQADRVARGVAQKTVTLASLREFEIPLPKIEDQKLFEHRISKVRLLAMGNQSDHLDNLFSALQHRAFTGQL